VLFEWIGPLIEVVGYVFMIAGFAFGLVSVPAFMTFMLVAFGFGLILSVNALLLEEISFHVYPKPSQLMALLGAAVVENAGYRHLNSVWRLWGLWRWLIGARGQWGDMKRSASWQRGA